MLLRMLLRVSLHRRMRTALALCVLCTGALPAFAGVTSSECEFVGAWENDPGLGGGDYRAPRPTRSRFAGAGEGLTEGPPAASGGPDFPGIPTPRIGYDPYDGCECDVRGWPDPYSNSIYLEERFTADGAQPVQGAGSTTVHDKQVYQNYPQCEGLGPGRPALYAWTFGLARAPISSLHIDVCLDVRSCSPNHGVGQNQTQSLPDYIDEHGFEAPVVARVVHHLGEFWFDRPSPRCACDDQKTTLLQNPGFRRIESGPDPWFDLLDPQPDQELDTIVSFIGRDCLRLTVENEGMFAPHDFITVQLRVPGSTRVRVRAAEDYASLCYIGTLAANERD